VGDLGRHHLVGVPARLAVCYFEALQGGHGEEIYRYRSKSKCIGPAMSFRPVTNFDRKRPNVASRTVSVPVRVRSTFVLSIE
jgi:hypothetical protein